MMLALSLTPTACSGDGDGDGDAGESTSSVEVRYTEYGIFHVRAADYHGLGYGQGFAQAKDNLCKIELGMLGFDGDLARHFGPDARASSLAPSSQTSTVSDFYFRGIRQRQVVEQLVERPAPLGPRAEVREMVRGYVAGFNEYLAQARGEACLGSAWIRPMTEMDVYRRAYAVTTFLDQGGRFSGAIVAAEPPRQSSAAQRSIQSSDGRQALAFARLEPSQRSASNGIALGGSLTQSGGGINLANPHL